MVRKGIYCRDPSGYLGIKMDMLTYSGQEFVIRAISNGTLKLYEISCEMGEFYCRKNWLEPVLPVQEKPRDDEETEVDWSKVAGDTPILVSDDDETWYRLHFAHYTNNCVCAWAHGKTSWTVPEPTCSYTTAYKYAKLFESEVG